MYLALIIYQGRLASKVGETFQKHQKLIADEYAYEPALVGALA